MRDWPRQLALACIVNLLAMVWAPEDRVTPDQFIQQSLKGLRGQTAINNGTWHLDEALEWSADQDAGTLVFTLPKGVVASASFQIVGTYNSEDGTFLWGWDHPSVQAPLRKDAQLARDWGEKHGIKDYTTRKLKCSEEKAWEFTAVAARLGAASGAYRGPSGSTYVFMTFGRIALRKQ